MMDCNLCSESGIAVGDKSKYGAAVIYRVGDDINGWIATLSPKTGGNPETDFSIQMMTTAHITQFSDMNESMATNYGLIFSHVSKAICTLLKEEQIGFVDPSPTRITAVSLATYGKCTTWIEKKEHIHIKLYPFSHALGQPSPVDSSFGRKEILKDSKGEEFVKFDPVYKKNIETKRFDYLKSRLVALLKQDK